MNWIKKFAQWLLSEELAEERKHYQKINDDLRADKKALEKSNEWLKRLAFGRRKHLVSQLMLECIVKCLPDPNAVGVGRISAADIIIRNMGFVDELGCKVEEITCLAIHPDNERSDEEGWQVESFFPRGIDPQTEIIDDDYHTSDFSVGSVIRLKQDGVVFVAETNVSPWIVYANPNIIEQL